MFPFGTPEISVIIPAHNEEKYIARCLESVWAAAEKVDVPVEAVVVCNRCTDRTKEFAENSGARCVEDESCYIAGVRNAGISAAEGRIIVTIDADNQMTVGTLSEIKELLDTGKYIGGGAPIRFERYSFPLRLNDWFCRICFALTGLYCGIFWAEKAVLSPVGGFVEKKVMEDVATAKRLREAGKRAGKRYGCLKENYLINSTRKFDQYGDWMYFRFAIKNVGALVLAAMGKGEKLDRLLEEIFYDVER